MFGPLVPTRSTVRRVVRTASAVLCPLFASVLAFDCAPVRAADPPPPRLLAHWPLRTDARDAVGAAHGTARRVTFGGGDLGSDAEGAAFDGRESRIDVPAAKVLDLGTRDFTLSVRVRCSLPMRSVPGDVLSRFDPVARRGFNLGVSGSSPAYSGMSDTRHVHFGIDDGHVGTWEDHGRPWPSNALVSNLVAFDGALYCGIADADRPEDRAHVFRFDGGRKWVDCGRLGTDPNHHSVMSLIVHRGKLCAGTGIWDWVQALGGLKGAPAPAPTRVFQYEGGTRWKDLGQVGHGSRVLTLASFDGDLYAGVDSVGKGHVYRHDGTAWHDCGSPDGKNLECLFAWGGILLASTHGNVYEYEGSTTWRRIGSAPHEINQIHSMQVFGGRVLLGTWPQGYVLRRDGDDVWTRIGRLGLPEGEKPCNEVMDLVVHNGCLYAGLIPKAEVYRYESDGRWTRLASLASRPDWSIDELPTWNRITCLTSFGGRLFAATGSCRGRSLDAAADPSLGRVLSLETGQVVAHHRDLGGEWTHLAAIRRGRTLELHVNGAVSKSAPLRDGDPFDLSADVPLRIGSGAQSSFHGRIADVRLYDGALDAEAVRRLAAPR